MSEFYKKLRRELSNEIASSVSLIRDNFDSLLNLPANHNKVDTEKVDSVYRGLQHLQMIARNLGSTTPCRCYKEYNKDCPTDVKEVDVQLIKNIEEIVMRNYTSPNFSIEDVIREIGMSRTTFYRRVKGLMPDPKDYIKDLRLRRALDLFQKGHTSVSEVCYMTGFSAPGYFTKCFQKEYGLRPKDYIAKVKNAYAALKSKSQQEPQSEE